MFDCFWVLTITDAEGNDVIEVFTGDIEGKRKALQKLRSVLQSLDVEVPSLDDYRCCMFTANLNESALYDHVKNDYLCTAGANDIYCNLVWRRLNE